MSTATTTPAPAAAPERAAKPLPPISWKAPVAYGVIGLLALVVFALLPAGGQQTTFRLSTAKDFFQIEPITVSSTGAALFLSILALLLAGLSFWAARDRRKVGVWLPIVYGVAIVFAFLSWAGAGKSAIPLTGLLQGSLFLAVPLVFGALSGVLCERVGIINIAIEGQLLAGAFLAAVVASLTSSAYAGLIAAPIAGALVGVLLVIFSVKYWVNQIIVGVVLNVLVVGVTSYLYSTVLSADPATWNSRNPLPVIEIPVLSQIPVVGPVLFRQTLLVYLMYVVVILLQVFLFRSRWGLRLRAVGEHPKAADTVGIKVNATRVRNTILGGAVAGLGGAFFTVAAGLAFGKEMTGGKGFIALAAMILGRWNPVGALVAALLFGFSDNLQTVLGIVGTPIPSQIMLMTPYVVTIFAVAGLVGRVRPPAAEGIPYVK
ncbi:nucleoside ABC transporter membrane protein [Cellulosimicrobium aquatile]|uniref:ABC transporter permease n=2 Tax=Cellulosimicrobium TaxID=157920 RepID=A0A4Y8R2Q5_9MICO|nr:MULTISPECIES: ABC transporter permease [Cellulosimicrobium]TGA75084.1 ABC transporter permease [Cellulosimicrobium terreum]MCM3534759.1 ABC transporter permease [Cellulosimicrobium funkei]MDQ8040731.1 ABC transporter permease [Cellulosimicrobium sp. XJ-DQ-B-000]NMF29544.1 ABC transporter permease [Cellulosimicrobium aquatile]QUC01331.1 ABC transporter permease [Cellulosimicrobium cellulans]